MFREASRHWRTNEPAPLRANHSPALPTGAVGQRASPSPTFSHHRPAKNKKCKKLDLPGFEPGAFRMQSGRATTALQTQGRAHGGTVFNPVYYGHLSGAVSRRRGSRQGCARRAARAWRHGELNGGDLEGDGAAGYDDGTWPAEQGGLPDLPELIFTEGCDDDGVDLGPCISLRRCSDGRLPVSGAGPSGDVDAVRVMLLGVSGE